MASFFSNVTKRLRARAGRLFRGAPSAPAMPLHTDHELVQGLSGSRLPSATQFTYLFRYLGKREGFVFRIATLLLFASAAVLVVRYVHRHWIPEPSVGGTYVEAVVGAPRYVNPVLATSDVDHELTSLVYSGPLRLLPDGTYANDLAQEVTASADGKTWTVTLKPNLTWQDGDPLTSDDVRFTVETMQDPNVASPHYTDVRDLKVDTPDEHTATFTFTKTPADPQALLAQGLLPAHIWGDIPAGAMGTSEYNVKPVGSGPYAFKEIRKKGTSGSVTTMVLQRFAGAATPALVKNLEVRFVDDQSAAVDAVSSGQANGTRLTKTETFTKARKVHGILAVEEPLPQVTAVFFNLKDNLFSRDVRLALRAAVDQQAVIDAGRPHAQPVNGPVLPGMPGGPAELPSARAADFTAAQKILTDAGWAKDGDVYKKKGASLAFTLTVPDAQEFTAAANVLVENWRALGATVTVNAIDPATITKSVIKGRTFDALLFADRYDASGDLYPFWHSSQSYDPGLNLTSYLNKDVDKLLTDAHAATASTQTRAEANQKADAAIQNDAPAIFLYQSYALLIKPSRLRSTAPMTLQSAANRFLDVTDWYVNTDHVWKWNP